MEQTDAGSFSINIRAPNPELVDHESISVYDGAVDAFTPKEGVKITRVCDDETVIWDDPRPVIRVAVIRRGETICMLSVPVAEDEAHGFVISEGVWIRIPSKVFYFFFYDLFHSRFGVNSIKVNLKVLERYKKLEIIWLTKAGMEDFLPPIFVTNQTPSSQTYNMCGSTSSLAYSLFGPPPVANAA